MNISEVLKPENVDLNLSSETKENALETMTSMLFNNGALTDKNSFLSDVLNRESISTTGIGGGIAIPHGKSKNVKETTVAFGRLAKPVQWQSVDDMPVNIIVLLAVNENDKNNNHIKLLSQIARKLVSADVCQKLSEAKSHEDIVKAFSE